VKHKLEEVELKRVADNAILSQEGKRNKEGIAYKREREDPIN
jgi:hypothetical protein